MRTTHGLGVVVALVLISSARAQTGQTPEGMLGAALHQERVTGNLQAAIDGYRKVLASKGVPRSVSAQAQYHIGLCYEKLGKQEARGAFETVLRNYADQKDVAAQARARLAAMAGDANSDVVQRRLWTSEAPTQFSNPSPDGRSVVFVSRGNLSLLDLTTGAARELTHGAEAAAANASKPLFSPDGKRVAYVWSSRDANELRVINVDGSGMRVLVKDKAIYASPYSWSPDGKHILAWVSRDSTPAKELALISVFDGSMRTIGKGRWITATSHAFSPDGRFITYSVMNDENKRTMWVMAADGTSGRPLLPGGETIEAGFQFWMPSGRTVLFQRWSSGNSELWSVAVADGNAAGEPQLLKRDFSGLVLGLAGENTLFYSTELNQRDVFIADFDPGSGRVSNVRRFNQDFFGAVGASVGWSPDGRVLAYTRHHSGSEDKIVIQPAGSGERREISSKSSSWRSHGLQWFADGQSLLDIDYSSRAITFRRFDVGTGAATTVFEAPQRKPWIHWQTALSPDGKTLFYSRIEYPPNADLALSTATLVSRQLATGQEKELYQTKTRGTGFFDLSLSPDSHELVFTFINADDKRWLGRVAVRGGEARLLHEGARGATWTRDGRRILFTQRGNGGIDELFLIPAGGGQPEATGLAMPEIWSPVVHPDGRRIAFVGGKRHQQGLWVMKNLLPQAVQTTPGK